MKFKISATVLQVAGEAQTYCQQEGGPDSYLASVLDEEENQHIWDRMKAHAQTDPPGYWIGYQKDGLGKYCHYISKYMVMCLRNFKMFLKNISCS